MRRGFGRLGWAAAARGGRLAEGQGQSGSGALERAGYGWAQRERCTSTYVRLLILWRRLCVGRSGLSIGGATWAPIGGLLVVAGRGWSALLVLRHSGRARGLVSGRLLVDGRLVGLLLARPIHGRMLLLLAVDLRAWGHLALLLVSVAVGWRRLVAGQRALGYQTEGDGALWARGEWGEGGGRLVCSDGLPLVGGCLV